MANFEEVSASSVDGFSSRAEDDDEGTTSGSDGEDLETLPDAPEPRVKSPSPTPPPPSLSSPLETASAAREQEIRQLVEAEFQARMPAKKGGKTASKKSAAPKSKKPSKQGKSKSKAAKKTVSKAANDNAKYRRLAAQILKIGT